MNETQSEVEALKTALREAILSPHRVTRTCVECDPAVGSTYEIDWTDQTKGWAELCGLNLEEHYPAAFRWRVVT